MIRTAARWPQASAGKALRGESAIVNAKAVPSRSTRSKVMSLVLVSMLANMPLAYAGHSTPDAEGEIYAGCWYVAHTLAGDCPALHGEEGHLQFKAAEGASHVRLVLTWDAVSEDAEELEANLYVCTATGCGGPSVSGPSPLVLEATGVEVDGAELGATIYLTGRCQPPYVSGYSCDDVTIKIVQDQTIHYAWYID